jgi:hypothetical protein
MFGKRPFDKPRKIWIESVEEDSIRLLRRRNWRSLSEDRVQWRAKIKTPRTVFCCRAIDDYGSDSRSVALQSYKIITIEMFAMHRARRSPT